jgi:hemolysin D
MEPTNKPPVGLLARIKRILGKGNSTVETTVIDFLPDADAIEQKPLPVAARITLHVLLTVFIVFLLWAYWAEMDLIVVAHGRLVTPLPNIVVQPLETSIIKSIDVHIGQLVKKGQTLATLDPTFSESDEAQLITRLHSMDNQLQWLDTALSGIKPKGMVGSDADSQLQTNLSIERHANYDAQVRKLTESIGRLRASLETTRRDEQAQSSSVRVLREMEAMQQELYSKQLAARARLLDAQQRRIEAERSMEMARNRQIEIRRELASLEAEKISFETGWRQKMMEELLSVSRERDSVNEQLLKADMRHKLVTLTSPAEAVVLEIGKLSQGSVVQGAEKLFTLVPLGSDLECEVQIDSADVGYVKAGDVVHVKMDAFPFQKHGALEAKLRFISQDAFKRDGSGSGLDSYYLGRINLLNKRLKSMPKDAKLIPGMTLSAEILVGKRSVMSYLLWPLTKAMDESLHEP